MKKGMGKFEVICLAVFIAAMFLVYLGCNVAYGDTTPDSARIAAAFLAAPIESWSGNFSFTRVTPGKETYVSGNFEMNKLRKITKLQQTGKDPGTVIDIIRPGDKPLNGLPIDAEGTRRGYSLYLTGCDKDGNGVAWGYFGTSQTEDDFLKPTDPIVVTLHAYLKEHFVSFAKPSGVAADDLVAEIEGNGLVFYDQSRQGFDLWLDPTQNPTVTIRDNRTGVAYWVGQASDLNQAPKEQAISLDYEGGVIDLFPGDNNYTIRQKERLDGQVVADDGTIEAAKVYMSQLGKQAVGMYFSGLSGSTGTMETYGVDDSGKMYIIDTYRLTPTPGPDPNPDSLYLMIPPSCDRMVFVVKGVSSFNLSANRYDSGGGKG